MALPKISNLFGVLNNKKLIPQASDLTGMGGKILPMSKCGNKLNSGHNVNSVINYSRKIFLNAIPSHLKFKLLLGDQKPNLI